MSPGVNLIYVLMAPTQELEEVELEILKMEVMLFALKALSQIVVVVDLNMEEMELMAYQQVILEPPELDLEVVVLEVILVILLLDKDKEDQELMVVL